jgi:hypothetical protein
LDHPAQPCGCTVQDSLYKSRAKSMPTEKPFRINTDRKLAEFHSTKHCCWTAQNGSRAAISLCSAKK